MDSFAFHCCVFVFFAFFPFIFLFFFPWLAIAPVWRPCLLPGCSGASGLGDRNGTERDIWKGTLFQKSIYIRECYLETRMVDNVSTSITCTFCYQIYNRIFDQIGSLPLIRRLVEVTISNRNSILRSKITLFQWNRKLILPMTSMVSIPLLFYP